MIAALDMQLALGTATGIGEYATGLARALRDTGVQTVELCEPRLDPWRFDRRVLWDQVLLPLRARASGARLLHCLSGTMPRVQTLPCVVTVHDVAWLKVQQHARPYARWYFGAFALAQYRRAAAIAVDSAFSAQELRGVLDIAPDRVHVIFPGVAEDFCALEALPRRERTVFVPGTVEPRKNLETAIRALAALDGARLVSAGPPTPYLERCRALARELGVEQRVEFLGYVPRERILQLYASCGVVAVPSRYEGFGYAAAQALCAGAPLVCSDAASLPEVAGGAAPLITPDDVPGWTTALARALNDPGAAQAQAAAARAQAVARFSWRTAAQQTLAMYERASA